MTFNTDFPRSRGVQILDAWGDLDGPGALDGRAILDGAGASRFWTLAALWTSRGRQES
jgi:hypothetical protein